MVSQDKLKTTSAASSIQLVIGTNDSSILSKRSAERLGYFTHPQFLKPFVHQPQRRAPLINIGYTVRTLLVDLVINRFLESHSLISNQPQPPLLIVNLGCGYDPGFFKHAANLQSRFHSTKQRLLYLDVDYPELISKKHQLITQSQDLNHILPAFAQAKIGDWVKLRSGKASYALLGSDLCDGQGFIEKLSGLLNGNNHTPILFISEVSTVYMPIQKSDQLLHQISQAFPNAVWSCLEQVLPASPSAFSVTMLKHFDKLRTPIQGTLGYPTLPNQVARLRSYWETVEMSTMQDLWNAFDHYPSTRIEKQRILQLEEFDEWEELDLFLSHYIVGIAYSQPEMMKIQISSDSIGLPPLQNRSDLDAHQLDQNSSSKSNLPWSCLSIDSPICRRGHTSSSLANGQILIFAGYGLHKSTIPTYQKEKCSKIHSRLSHPILLKFSQTGSFQTTELPISHLTPSSRLYHTATPIHKDDQTTWVFVFGGRSAPRAPLMDGHLFDCSSYTWKPVHQSDEQAWPPPRFRHVALNIKIGNSSYVFVHGGIGLKGIILKDSWLFDPNTSQWTQLDLLDELIGPRHSHQLFYDPDDSKLYVFGGVTSICDEPSRNRIGRNIKVDLQFKSDLSLSANLSELSIQSEPYIHIPLERYSHQITPWDLDKKQLILGGGLSKDGLITTENQYVLLDIKLNTFHLLDLSDRSPQTMVGHTLSTLDLVTDSNNQSHISKGVVALGGGATCFSFGASFDNLAEIITNSDLKFLDHNSKLSIDNNFQYGTLNSLPKDTWDQLEAIGETILEENLTSEGWKEVISASRPVKFNFESGIGDCLKVWEPEYLKLKCGDQKCSIHQSSSEQLNWHERNFKYSTVRFDELINQTLLMNTTKDPDGTSQSKPKTVYLRALSHHPKQPANFFQDFPAIAPDFKIPKVIDDYITETNGLFSSVLRISGADMGLWAHYDTYDNILIQIRGQKLVRLWHPIEMMNLYIDGSSSHIPNFQAPDLDRFPLYRKAHPIVCVMKPGDALFIPANWIHSVQTIEPSVGINIFFKTEQLGKFYETKTVDVWGNVDLGPYRELHNQIFDKLIGHPSCIDGPHPSTPAFARMPLTQRQFYLKKLAADLVRFADQLTQ